MQGESILQHGLVCMPSRNAWIAKQHSAWDKWLQAINIPIGKATARLSYDADSWPLLLLVLNHVPYSSRGHLDLLQILRCINLGFILETKYLWICQVLSWSRAAEGHSSI